MFLFPDFSSTLTFPANKKPALIVVHSAKNKWDSVMQPCFSVERQAECITRSFANCRPERWNLLLSSVLIYVTFDLNGITGCFHYFPNLKHGYDAGRNFALSVWNPSLFIPPHACFVIRLWYACIPKSKSSTRTFLFTRIDLRSKFLSFSPPFLSFSV